MIRFHQTFGAHTGRVHELDADVITFGRLPECDVSFDARADLDASGRHAEVRREGGFWHVVDVGSRNGTWVNGSRVQSSVLHTGDEIEFGLGGPRMRVEILDGRHATGPMTPAGPNQATAAATPVSVGAHPGIEGTAPTLMAPSSHPGSGKGSSPGGPPSVGDPQPAPTPGHGEREAKYGHRTVSMMIQSAVEQARREGARRPTALLLIAGLAIVFLLAVGVLLAVLLLARGSSF